MHTQAIHFVTGKGGVGKTSAACALALAEAREGRRVLLAEINGGDATCRALGVAPVGYEMREVHKNLWAIDLTPEASLREYVLLIIKIESLYRTVFESRMVSSFLKLLPALGELTMLGKLWFEATEPGPEGRGRFDVIVIDAPATGHARALLSAGAQVKRSIPAGPMRENAERIDTMLHDPRTRVHVVTTPESMPVEEANELLSFAREGNFHEGLCIINQLIPHLEQGLIDKLAPLGVASPFEHLKEALAARSHRQQAGERALAKLSWPMHQRCELAQTAATELTPEALLDLGHMALNMLTPIGGSP